MTMKLMHKNFCQVVELKVISFPSVLREILSEQYYERK